ncbi:MAG TPA: hypothetical protein VFK05_30400 [Polyangiaceae bacterium]|nr:hypothetical protein [Polyangiaceae bacterium]
MDCSQIRDSFLKGAAVPDDAVREHLASCAPCRALFEQDSQLARELAAQAATDVLSLPMDVFGQIEQRLAGETGPRAWLRSRPSRMRFLVVLLLALFVLVAGGLLRQRADFAQYPALRVVMLLCVYLLALALAFGKELLERSRSESFRDHWVLLAFALGVPILAAFAPATELSRQAGPEGALNCFGYGALLTLPIALLLWAFDRDDRPTLRTVCLSAAALGLAANLLLELHCGNGNPAHVLLGHASLGVAWLLAWAVVRGVSRV